MVFQNMLLKRTFGPKKEELAGGWGKLKIEELPNHVCFLFILTIGNCRI
jgi:hypothetical protein